MIGSGTETRRVWQRARAQRREAGYAVMLDDRPLRLPSGSMLLIAEAPLADAVAAEWNPDASGAGGVPAADSLRLTPLAAARQERVAPDRLRVIDHLLGFLDGDALRYRAEPDTGLRDKQDRLWDPWLTRWAERIGAPLSVTTGVMPAPPDDAATARAAAWLEAMDDTRLTVLAVLVPAFGSLVLGMAVAEDALDGRDALALSLLDEHDQRSRWGTVAESEARDLALDREVGAAIEFLALCTRGGTDHVG